MRAGLTGVFKSDGGLRGGSLEGRSASLSARQAGRVLRQDIRLAQCSALKGSPTAGLATARYLPPLFPRPGTLGTGRVSGSAIRDFAPGEFAVVGDAVYIFWRRLKDHEVVFEADFADLVGIHAGGV